MLFWYLIRFVKNLAPAVFTGRFSSKHYQLVCREHVIMIAFTIRKYKIGLLVVFCNSLLLENKIVNDSWICLGNANILGCFRRNLYLCSKKDE